MDVKCAKLHEMIDEMASNMKGLDTGYPKSIDILFEESADDDDEKEKVIELELLAKAVREKPVDPNEIEDLEEFMNKKEGSSTCSKSHPL